MVSSSCQDPDRKNVMKKLSIIELIWPKHRENRHNHRYHGSREKRGEKERKRQKRREKEWKGEK